MWKWVTAPLRRALQWRGPAALFQGPVSGFFRSVGSGRPSPLYSAFPLFITHQPPPLHFSLFLCLFPSLPLCSTTHPPPLFPALLESEALYGEFITTAAAVQPSPVHLGPGPGPRVQCQARMCLAGRTEILIFCPRLRGAIAPSHPCPSPSRCGPPPQPQPPYQTAVPTFQQDCMPGQ